MPRNAYGAWPKSDSNVAGGYGSIKPRSGEDQAGSLYPYIELTPAEASSEDDEEEEGSQTALRRKGDGRQPMDRLSQLNYHSGAYVNGATRGLTGIMSGKEAEKILEAFFGQGAPGQAEPTGIVNKADIFRTRPGRRTGSKKGWFSPPPPKDGDPDPRAYTLADIALDDDEMPMIHADMARKRATRSDQVETLVKRFVRLLVHG